MVNFYFRLKLIASANFLIKLVLNICNFYKNLLNNFVTSNLHNSTTSWRIFAYEIIQLFKKLT